MYKGNSGDVVEVSVAVADFDVNEYKDLAIGVLSDDAGACHQARELCARKVPTGLLTDFLLLKGEQILQLLSEGYLFISILYGHFEHS